MHFSGLAVKINRITHAICHKKLQNLSFNYIIQSGIASRCDQDECGEAYHSNGFELRINGSSFYSFPFALSYQVHHPLFDENNSMKHYIKLLFEFME